MKRTIDYRILGESRAEIMGLMILAVIFYHSGIDWSGVRWGMPFEFVRRSLYFSVDIFLFLSGFGLVRSRLTHPGPWGTFLYRRMMRILPAYWLMLSVLWAYEVATGRMPGVPTVFFRFSTLGFWFGKQGPLAAEWFIPALLGLYLLFPPLFTLYEQTLSKARFVAWSIVLALSIGILPILIGHNNLLMMTTRIPAFILGIHFGHLAFSPGAAGNRSMSIQRAIFWVLLAFAALAVVFGTTTEAERWRYGLWWPPLILAIAPVSLLLGQWIAWMKRGIRWRRFAKPVLWLLGFSGAYSLELLLLHEPLYELVRRTDGLSHRVGALGPTIHGLNRGHYLEFIACTAATLALAPLLSRAAALVRTGVDSFVEAKTDEAKALRKWFLAGIAAALIAGLLFGVLLQKSFGIGNLVRAAGGMLGLR